VFAYWLGSYTLPFLSYVLLALIALVLERLRRERSALAIHLAAMPQCMPVVRIRGLFSGLLRKK
jgi:hypothetical protein